MDRDFSLCPIVMLKLSSLRTSVIEFLLLSCTSTIGPLPTRSILKKIQPGFSLRTDGHMFSTTWAPAKRDQPYMLVTTLWMNDLYVEHLLSRRFQHLPLSGSEKYLLVFHIDPQYLYMASKKKDLSCSPSLLISTSSTTTGSVCWKKRCTNVLTSMRSSLMSLLSYVIPGRNAGK